MKTFFAIFFFICSALAQTTEPQAPKVSQTAGTAYIYSEKDNATNDIYIFRVVFISSSRMEIYRGYIPSANPKNLYYNIFSGSYSKSGNTYTLNLSKPHTNWIWNEDHETMSFTSTAVNPAEERAFTINGATVTMKNAARYGWSHFGHFSEANINAWSAFGPPFCKPTTHICY